MKPKHCFLVLQLILVAALVLVGSPFLLGEQAGYTGADDLKLCGKCHKDQYGVYRDTAHRKSALLPHLQPDQVGCDACHGPSGLHLQDPSKKEGQLALRFADFSKSKQNGTCLKCHTNEHLFSWRTSAHSRNDMSCTTCHSGHHAEGPKNLRKRQPSLCYDCHKEKRVEFRMPSRHAVEEGKMECSSCHNTHGGLTQNLNGENVRESCLKCHAEYSGPFAFEHPPSAERCTICHKAHGSVNNNLLSLPQPMLCLKCHAPQHVGWVRRGTGGAPAGNVFSANNVSRRVARGLAYQQCSHCHSKLHGSDQNRGRTY